MLRSGQHVCVQAFLAASLKTDAELLKWFRDRLVWNEPETVVDLLKNGLFVRLYEPQVDPPTAHSPRFLLCQHARTPQHTTVANYVKRVAATLAMNWGKGPGRSKILSRPALAEVAGKWTICEQPPVVQGVLQQLNCPTVVGR